MRQNQLGDNTLCVAKTSSKIRWIGSLLGIGLLRGIFVPDYRSDCALWIIPFVMPAIYALVATLAQFTHALVPRHALFWSLLTILISDVTGIIVYGSQTKWWYVTHDGETHAVLLLTLFIQIVSFAIIYGSLFFLMKFVRKMKRIT